MGGPRYHNQPITAADRQNDHRRGVPADPRRPADGVVRPADFAGQERVPAGHLAARHPAGCGRYRAGSAGQDSGSVRLAGCPFDCLDSDLPSEDPLSRRSGTSSKPVTSCGRSRRQLLTDVSAGQLSAAVLPVEAPNLAKGPSCLEKPRSRRAVHCLHPHWRPSDPQPIHDDAFPPGRQDDWAPYPIPRIGIRNLDPWQTKQHRHQHSADICHAPRLIPAQASLPRPNAAPPPTGNAFHPCCRASHTCARHRYARRESRAGCVPRWAGRVTGAERRRRRCPTSHVQNNNCNWASSRARTSKSRRAMTCARSCSDRRIPRRSDVDDPRSRHRPLSGFATTAASFPD